MKRTLITIILSILTYSLTPLTSKQNEFANDFSADIENFIKNYLADFSLVSERYRENGNDFLLDKTEAIWNKSVTLKRKKSFKNKYNQIVFQRIFLGFYQYDTEEQFSIALDNVLDFFKSESGKIIQWGDTINGFKITPTIYLINEKTIIACRIWCEHENDFWQVFKHDLIKAFTNETSAIIEAGCGGPVIFRKN